MYNTLRDGTSAEPLYPFGYGLSYTSFSYGKLRMVSDEIPASGNLTASIEVTNTGNRLGDEVVQLYIRDRECSVVRPEKQLVGFERITLEPGESRTVSFNVPAEELAFWDAGSGGWIVEPGEFEVMAGSSSADIRSAGPFRIY